MIAVTGASGWIGRSVVKELESRKQLFRAIDVTAGNGRIEWNCLSRGAEDTLSRAIEGCHSVIHCVGHVHRPVETAEEADLFERINIGGTEQLVGACRRAGAERVVYIGTLAVYSWRRGEPAPEDGPIATTTHYARTKYAGEAIVRESGLDWRVLRLATVFGAGDRANFARLAAAIKRGRFVVPGDGAARKSVIEVRDAARLLVDAALVNEPRHRLMNAANPVPVSLRAICDAFVDVCGSRPPRSLPYVVMRAAALAGDAVALVHPRFPLTTGSLAKLTTDTIVDVTRMRETFPRHPWRTFRESLDDSADYYASL